MSDRKRKAIRRVAIIGSQGVPPKYGGFETLVDNILDNSSGNVDYTVFCSAPDMDTDLTEYKGSHLKYINLRAHGIMSIPYDIISMIRAMWKNDALLVLGVSGCVFLPVVRLLSRTRIIVNIDGLEHKRDKWDSMAKRFLKFSLGSSMHWAHEIVSDNKGIQSFVKEHYGREARLIAYGGNHALRNVDRKRQKAILDFHGLEAGTYDLSICRIEPENNCDMTLRAYLNSNRRLAFIGNWDRSDYSRDLYERYHNEPNLHLINSIYDLDALFALRNNARIYVHGHRAGGTNPSLVEAMFFNRPILAFDVIYNRETTQGRAYYYTDSETLRDLMERDDLSDRGIGKIARDQYNWTDISRQYEELY